MREMVDYDLLSVQEARILAEEATEAQRALRELEQETLDLFVERAADEAEAHAEELADLSAVETGIGRREDKLLKNRFVCRQLRQAMRGMRYVGVLARDCAGYVTDIGVPRGTVAAFCPRVSPVSTTIYQVLIALKSGNSIIVSPHPGTERVVARAMDVMMEATEKCGLPPGAVSYLRSPCSAGARELLRHRAVSQILMTGVPSLMPAAAGSGKPVLYGSAGNGPAFIERTADIRQAVSDIILSKCFDNGAAAAAEQSVVVDAPVAEAVRAAFTDMGAYFMTDEEAKRLETIVFRASDGGVNGESVGKPATFLAERAGFTIPPHTRLLISHQKYVSEKNPYSGEKYCPVLAYYVEDNWVHACEKCIELLLHGKQGHTLVIHSRDEHVTEQFALKKPVARVLVNTPSSLGGIGMTTGLFPAMTLGGETAGLGVTADNVSPANLTYIRKVGYGVRSVEELSAPVPETEKASDMEMFRRRLEKAMKRAD